MPPPPTPIDSTPSSPRDSAWRGRFSQENAPLHQVPSMGSAHENQAPFHPSALPQSLPLESALPSESSPLESLQPLAASESSPLESLQPLAASESSSLHPPRLSASESSASEPASSRAALASSISSRPSSALRPASRASATSPDLHRLNILSHFLLRNNIHPHNHHPRFHRHLSQQHSRTSGASASSRNRRSRHQQVRFRIANTIHNTRHRDHDSAYSHPLRDSAETTPLLASTSPSSSLSSRRRQRQRQRRLGMSLANSHAPQQLPDANITNTDNSTRPSSPPPPVATMSSPSTTSSPSSSSSSSSSSISDITHHHHRHHHGGSRIHQLLPYGSARHAYAYVNAIRAGSRQDEPENDGHDGNMYTQAFQALVDIMAMNDDMLDIIGDGLPRDASHQRPANRPQLQGTDSELPDLPVELEHRGSESDVGWDDDGDSSHDSDYEDDGIQRELDQVSESESDWEAMSSQDSEDDDPRNFYHGLNQQHHQQQQQRRRERLLLSSARQEATNQGLIIPAVSPSNSYGAASTLLPPPPTPPPRIPLPPSPPLPPPRATIGISPAPPPPAISPPHLTEHDNSPTYNSDIDLDSHISLLPIPLARQNAIRRRPSQRWYAPSSNFNGHHLHYNPKKPNEYNTVILDKQPHVTARCNWLDAYIMSQLPPSSFSSSMSSSPTNHCFDIINYKCHPLDYAKCFQGHDHSSELSLLAQNLDSAEMTQDLQHFYLDRLYIIRQFINDAPIMPVISPLFQFHYVDHKFCCGDTNESKKNSSDTSTVGYNSIPNTGSWSSICSYPSAQRQGVKSNDSFITVEEYLDKFLQERKSGMLWEPPQKTTNATSRSSSANKGVTRQKSHKRELSFDNLPLPKKQKLPGVEDSVKIKSPAISDPVHHKKRNIRPKSSNIESPKTKSSSARFDKTLQAPAGQYMKSSELTIDQKARIMNVLPCSHLKSGSTFAMSLEDGTLPDNPSLSDSPSAPKLQGPKVDINFYNVDYNQLELDGKFILSNGVPYSNHSANSKRISEISADDFISFLCGTRFVGSRWPSDESRNPIIEKRIRILSQLMHTLPADQVNRDDRTPFHIDFSGSIVDFKNNDLRFFPKRGNGERLSNSINASSSSRRLHESRMANEKTRFELSQWLQIEPFNQCISSLLFHNLTYITKNLKDLGHLKSKHRKGTIFLAEAFIHNIKSICRPLPFFAYRPFPDLQSDKHATKSCVCRATLDRNFRNAWKSKVIDVLTSFVTCKDHCLLNIQLNYVLFTLTLDLTKVLDDYILYKIGFLADGSEKRRAFEHLYANYGCHVAKGKRSYYSKLLCSLDRKTGQIQIVSPLRAMNIDDKYTHEMDQHVSKSTSAFPNSALSGLPAGFSVRNSAGNRSGNARLDEDLTAAASPAAYGDNYGVSLIEQDIDDIDSDNDLSFSESSPPEDPFEELLASVAPFGARNEPQARSDAGPYEICMGYPKRSNAGNGLSCGGGNSSFSFV